MANNLHVICHLRRPSENLDALVDLIRQLGPAIEIVKSWYVRSEFTSAEAIDVLVPALRDQDVIFILDANNNTAAWNGLSPAVAAFIQRCWFE